MQGYLGHIIAVHLTLPPLHKSNKNVDQYNQILRSIIKPFGSTNFFQYFISFNVIKYTNCLDVFSVFTKLLLFNISIFLIYLTYI